MASAVDESAESPVHTPADEEMEIKDDDEPLPQAVGDGLGPSGDGSNASKMDLNNLSPMNTAELMKKLSQLTDQLKSLNLPLPTGTDNGKHDDDDDETISLPDSEDEGAAGDKSAVPKKKERLVEAKKPEAAAPSAEQISRGHWDWERTEAALLRCLTTGAKGVLPANFKGRESGKIVDVFDAQMAVQWVRRMEQLRAGAAPLPMRGPFLGKLPPYRRLQENPLKLTLLPLDCDLSLVPEENGKDIKPYRLGGVPNDIQSQRAFETWQTRNAYLKQFEIESLQMERLSAIQTLVVTDLLTAFKQKMNMGSAEVRALFADITPRLNDLQTLNDFMVNRTELLAYSTYKASKCIYLEAAGVPQDEWGQLIARKWGASELFDSKDTAYFKQKAMRMRGEMDTHFQPSARRGPLLCAPQSYTEPQRPMPPFHDGPMMAPHHPHHMSRPGPPPFMMEDPFHHPGHGHHPGGPWGGGHGGPRGFMPPPRPMSMPMGRNLPHNHPRQLFEPNERRRMPNPTSQPRPLMGGGVAKKQGQAAQGKAGAKAKHTADKKPSTPSAAETAVLVNQIESLLQELAKGGGDEGIEVGN